MGSRTSRLARQATRALSAFLLAVCVLVAVLFVVATVVNNDLYGRMTESHELPRATSNSRSGPDIPTLTLRIHRLLADENVAEVSLVGTIRRSTYDAPIPPFVASVHDGSSLQPFALRTSVDLEAGNATPFEVAASSPRFLLPTVHSVAGFPWDEIMLEPAVIVRPVDGLSPAFVLQIQKATPGRLLHVEGSPSRPSIRLVRPTTEIVFVVGSALVFLVLSLLLALTLLGKPDGLKALDELLAVAGYIVAAAGFREILGLSRISGVCVLEVVTLGLPLLILSIAVAASYFRSAVPSEQSK
jgi:hypothetical protein